MKKKLFAMLLSLVMILSSVSILSEVSFAEGEDDEAVVLNEEEAIDLGEEKTPEAVGAPAALDLATINTIAKDNAGKYYGVKTTGTNDDFGTRKIFYPLTKDQYDEVANDCFMIFKREDGKAFEIPSARLFIDTDPYNPQNAGTIFTELQFRYHVAFQTGILANNDPTNPKRVPGVEGVMWQIDLKDDWIIQKTDGFKTNQDYAPPIDLVFNVTINGNGKKIYRTKGTDDDRYNTIMYLGPSPTVKSTTANIKNLIIDGSEQYRCVILRELGILNVGGSDENNNEGVEIKDGYSNISSISGGITLLGNSGKKYTKLNVLANPNYTNLKITNCKAPRGGAIYADDKSIVDINNAEFTENKASMGGALYSSKEAYTISIKNSVFSKNKALAIDNDKQMVGGAIVNKSKLTIEDCEFNGNEATNQAGAILFQSDTNVLTIKGSTFTENKSTANAGGAICAYGKVEVSDIKAPIEKKTVFTKNEAKWGGAIYDKGNSSINDVSFDSNIATAEGGAIYTSDKNYENKVDATKDYQNLTIDEKTTFTNNKANGYFNPPENVKELKNIKFNRTTFTGTKKIKPDHPLNNYDINYINPKITITYNSNGGTPEEKVYEGDIELDTKENITPFKHQIQTIEETGLSKNGSTFKGWNTKKDGTGENYKVGETKEISSNLYLYAIWDTPAPKPTEPTTLILTLDENHRSGEITNIEVEEGDLIEPHLYIPRRRGYIFKGWSYDRKHLDEVKPGVRIYSDTTLYAIWKKAEIEREEEPVEIKGEEHITYIFGYPNGTVRPNGSITRAEAAAMLARLLNIEAIGSAAKPQFTDTESSWYNKAINVSVFRGIMKGYPDGRFRPNAPITRAEFTQMISTIDNKPYGVAPFADVPGHWAERAIGSEYQAKRITGYPDGLFRPDANITRAEAAVILNKIFERKYDNLSLLKCKNPQMIKRFTDLDETFWGWNDMVEATNTHEYVRRDINKLPEDWLLIK